MIWRCACAAFLLLGAQQTFRSGADGVRVDVQVQVGKKPVASLTAADFDLRDSGVRQDVQALAVEDVPLSLLLALDVSASVKGEKLDRLKDAARAAVAALRPIDQAALVTFSQKVSLLSQWTADRAALATAIDGASAEGGTSLHDAVFTAVSLREHAAGRTVLLLFTDGFDTMSWLDPASVIESARRSDLVVYAVSTAPVISRRGGDGGVSPRFRGLFEQDPSFFPYAFLEKLTDDSGGELMYVKPGSDLSAVFRTIVADFKTRYLLTYAPAGVSASGWHPIAVTVKVKGATVRARRGYTR